MRTNPAPSLLLSIGLAAAVAVPFTATSSASPADRVVRYGGVRVDVPAGWDVVDLRRDPQACVRFDRHVVYLGAASRDQRCPAHLVGRTEAVQLAPGGAPIRGATTRAQHGLSLATRTSTAAREVRAHVVRPGVDVVATYGADRPAVERVLASLAPDGATAPEPAPMTPAAAVLPAYTGPATGGTPYGGEGVDACAAPSAAAMSAWLASPYRAMGVYIGGAARACAQPNLTSSWVTGVEQQGWRLIPIYVGLQAPCTNFANRIDPTQAAAQGKAAADDAGDQAALLGMPVGSPIYFDMEYYNRATSGCSQAVLTFLDAWTRELHAQGLLSGVYGSATAAPTDLTNQATNSSYALPNDIWIANWNGQDTVWGDSSVPDGYWSQHQRIHQYSGGGNETWGGSTINVDKNALDGDIVMGDESAGAPYGAEAVGPGATTSGFSTTGTWTDAAPYGLLGRMLSAPSSGASSTAQASWAPTLQPGSYDVAAYVPRVATANVTYTVTDANGTTTHPLAQGSRPGQWVSLGQFTAASGGITVTLGTAGDAAGATTVAADAMRFHYSAAAASSPPPPTFDGVDQPDRTAGQPATLRGTAPAGASVDVYDSNVTLTAPKKIGTAVADGSGAWSFTYRPQYDDQVYVQDTSGQRSGTKAVGVVVKVTIDSVRFLGRDARGRCVTRFLGGTYPYVPGASVWIRDASTSPTTPIGSATVTEYGGSGRYDSRFGLVCGRTYQLFALVSGQGADGLRYADNGTSATTAYPAGT